MQALWVLYWGSREANGNVGACLAAHHPCINPILGLLLVILGGLPFLGMLIFGKEHELRNSPGPVVITGIMAFVGILILFARRR